MLRDLTIQNYHCFKDFHIDGLARVNLIVGMNNSGKTSLLEAIYLLVNQNRVESLAELLLNRDEIISVRDDGSIEQSDQFHSQFFLSTKNLTFNQLAALWDNITLTPQEEKVVKALRILEPAVERIGFTSRQTSNSDILLKLRGQNQSVPLSSMGEGMRRILTLSMAAVTAENGVLLVDEIETGLYYETQTDMWCFILEVAQQLNIQVFATTHSWDCIAAFQEALDELEDNSVGKLFRLSRKGETIRPVEYPADKLSVAVRQSIEVR